MARPLRLQFPGALYHVTARGNEKKKIFKDRRDYLIFEELLAELPDRFSLITHSYVLMGNHYHLLVETPKANLSKVMHYLNTAYTGYFNRRHRRAGHLYGGRYKAILVEKGSYLLVLSRYIHLNPYRAGIVKRLDRYPWSSYMGYVRESEEKDWVNYGWILSQLDEEPWRARRLYQQFVLEGIRGEIQNPLDELRKGFILGSEQFENRVVEQVKGKVHREIPDTKRLRETVSLREITELVSEYFKVDPLVLTVRGTRRNLARSVAIYLARRHTFEDNHKIGKHFNIGYTAVSHVAGRLKRQMSEDRRLREMLEELEVKIKSIMKT